MGAMAEEIVLEAEPFVETCSRLYSKWKVSHSAGCCARACAPGCRRRRPDEFPTATTRQLTPALE